MYPDSRILKFKGLAIHHRVLAPAGPILRRALLIPSPGQSTYSWRRVAEELVGQGCLVALCDLPGFGFSSCGEGVPHRQDQRARLLWGVLDEIDMEFGGKYRFWSLIGHGSGAGTAAAMAILAPDSVASIALVNPILYPLTGAALSRLLKTRAGERLLKRWHRRHLQDRARLFKLSKWLYGAPLRDEALYRLREPFARAGADEALPKLLTQGYRVPKRALARLFPPALILWGGRDRLLGARIPKRLASRLPNAECHVLPRAGHCAPETNSRAVCDYLRGWLRAMG